MQYMYVIKTFDMHCTTGIKVVPWVWAINVHGLDELALYEKARDKHSNKCSKERTKKRKKVSQAALRIIEGVVIAILSAVIIKFFG